MNSKRETYPVIWADAHSILSLLWACSFISTVLSGAKNEFVISLPMKKGKRCMIRNRKLPDLQKEIFLPAVVNLVGGRKVNVINRGSL